MLQSVSWCFYSATWSDSSNDRRKEWKQAGLRASGSSDGKVLFRMKKFLSGDLDAVARHFSDALESVEITRASGVFTVSREGYSGEGTAS